MCSISNNHFKIPARCGQIRHISRAKGKVAFIAAGVDSFLLILLLFQVADDIQAAEDRLRGVRDLTCNFPAPGSACWDDHSYMLWGVWIMLVTISGSGLLKCFHSSLVGLTSKACGHVRHSGVSVSDRILVVTFDTTSALRNAFQFRVSVGLGRTYFYLVHVCCLLAAAF